MWSVANAGGAAAPEPEPEPEPAAPAAPALSADDVKAMKVTGLRDALTERGLDTKGVKADLAKRLLAAL